MTSNARPIRHVAISGASGLIGSALGASLRDAGLTVSRLGRGRPDPAALDGVDAVVHLAGEPIAQRWSAGAKQRIRASRVEGTTLLADAICRAPRPPRVLLSGSAVGIYGDRGDEVLEESSAPGTDWLAHVARDWEAAAARVREAGVRLASLRTGVVLSPRGGALAKLLPPFRLGAGGPIGNGAQWMSWISLHDIVQALRFLLDTENLSGPVNLVAPTPVTNRDFAHTLGRVLHRPALVPLPAFALKLAFGEMTEATLLASQRAVPRVLLDAGFHFRDADLASALSRELSER